MNTRKGVFLARKRPSIPKRSGTNTIGGGSSKKNDVGTR